MNKIKELYEYRQMLKSLILSDLRTRYKGSILGFLWTFLNPLLMLVIYSMIFSTIMRMDMKNYPVFLFIGLLPWLFFSTSIINSTSVIIRNANLIKKIYFPREVLPISVVLGGMINYLFGLFIMIPALYVFGMKLTVTALYFPLILLIQTLLLISVCILLSALTVYFRDLEHIMGVVTTAWFYITPIIFPASNIPKQYLLFFNLNPLKPIIESYQQIFYYNSPPQLENILVTSGYSMIFLVISGWIFKRLNRRFAEEV